MTFLGSRSFSLAPSSSSNLRDFSTAFSLLGYRGGCVFFFLLFMKDNNNTTTPHTAKKKKQYEMIHISPHMSYELCQLSLQSQIKQPTNGVTQASALSNDWSQTSGPPRHERWPTVKCAFHHLWA